MSSCTDNTHNVRVLRLWKQSDGSIIFTGTAPPASLVSFSLHFGTSGWLRYNVAALWVPIRLARRGCHLFISHNATATVVASVYLGNTPPGPLISHPSPPPPPRLVPLSQVGGHTAWWKAAEPSSVATRQDDWSLHFRLYYRLVEWTLE